MSQRATILLAHGSRDPMWSQPIEAVADVMRRIDPALAVRCAYLEMMEPALPAVVRDLAAAGVTQLHIVPMFLGVGRHAREDLPELVAGLQQAYPQLRLDLRPSIGEDARVVEAIARFALS